MRVGLQKIIKKDFARRLPEEYSLDREIRNRYSDVSRVRDAEFIALQNMRSGEQSCKAVGFVAASVYATRAAKQPCGTV